jgi:MFS family permease
MIPAGFLLMAIGYVIVALCGKSVPLMLLGVFIVGMSLTMVSPQGIVSISRYVSPNNSFFATMLFNCIMNGLAGFLAAPVYTGISQLISGDSTIGRFIFVAASSLAVGAVFLTVTVLRTRKGVTWR